MSVGSGESLSSGGSSAGALGSSSTGKQEILAVERNLTLDSGFATEEDDAGPGSIRLNSTLVAAMGACGTQ